MTQATPTAAGVSVSLAEIVQRNTHDTGTCDQQCPYVNGDDIASEAFEAGRRASLLASAAGWAEPVMTIGIDESEKCRSLPFGMKLYAAPPPPVGELQGVSEEEVERAAITWFADHPGHVPGPKANMRITLEEFLRGRPVAVEVRVQQVMAVILGRTDLRLCAGAGLIAEIEDALRTALARPLEVAGVTDAEVQAAQEIVEASANDGYLLDSAMRRALEQFSTSRATPIQLSVKRSEWEVLSPEAQEVLMSAGRRAVKATEEQRRNQAEALARFPRTPFAASRAPVAVGVEPVDAQNPKFTMDEWSAHARKHRWRFDLETPVALSQNRYHIDKSEAGFWPYVVRCGDGTQVLYKGHLKSCQTVAQALTGAFLDGAFVAVNGVPPKPQADCAGTSPCSTCPDTPVCAKAGCIRQTEYISDAAARGEA